MNWFLKALRQYADFKGRARRSEYWYFCLFFLLLSIGAALIDAVLGVDPLAGTGVVGGLLMLALFVPSLSVSVRRLHDIGRSGWWVLIGLIPLIGLIVLIVFAVQDSQPGDNAYGPNPKGVSA